jgi:hypothetical protein
LYAQYLLTHTTRAWRKKYVHGFTPIAGNFPGQGALYPIFFTGLNIEDFSFPITKENAESSARMYLSAPTSYMSAADPRIFGAERADCVRELERIALGHDPSANARDRLTALKELLSLDAHPGAPSVLQVFFGPGVDGEMPTETVDAPADTETIDAPA